MSERTETVDETQKIGVAKLVRSLDGYTGVARLYQLNPPVKWREGYDDDVKENETEFVVVSAAIDPSSGPETFIFPADAEGEMVDWTVLDGSSKGTLDHEQALRGAGYTI